MKKVAIIFFISIIIMTFFIRTVTYLQPVDRNNDEKIAINIEKGSSSQKIASVLYNNRLIRSKFAFNLLITLFGYEDELKAGYYNISPSKNLQEIIQIIHRGEVETFKVTFPEGSTLKDIITKLTSKTFYNKSEFLDAAHNIKINREYITREKNEVKYKIEGFLYPETYIFPKSYNPYQIYKVMINEFEKRWYKKIKTTSDKNEYSLYQIITIASLVEKEAKFDNEKKIIANVIYNRLQKNMPLQIDATVQYVLPDRKKRLLYSDLEVKSSYNTYKNNGLPPGPICNPGSKAIEAAINPENTKYLFYFAKDDGTHVFSKTYKEHIELQNKILNNNNK